MIGLLFDFLAAGLFATFLFVTLQFQTGFLVGRGFTIWRYHFRVDGDHKKKLTYSLWKEEK